MFRYYWVLIAVLLTTMATAVMVMHMPTVSSQADHARIAKGAEVDQWGRDLLHSGLGLVVLLAVLMLNVDEPPGMTRYGWRKQTEQRRRQAGQSTTLVP